MKKLYLKEIDSTNRYLKSNYETLEDMTWLHSDIQTHGKGTKDRIWFGNHESLMCSVLLKEKLDIDTIHLIPLLAAQVLHKVLSTYNQHILIKWPNDLLILDKKLSGVLVESIILNNQVLALVVGFGINLNQQCFDDNLKDIATSLKLHTSINYDKKVIFNQLIEQFEKDYLVFRNDSQQTIDYCNRYHALNHQMICFMDDNQKKEAQVIKIHHDGTLLVLMDKKEIALSNKDISIIK